MSSVALRERQADQVRVPGDEAQILAVLLRQRRQPEVGVRQVDPLLAAQLVALRRAALISTVTTERSALRTTPPIRPSSSQTRSPGRTRVKTCGSVQPIVAGAITRPSGSMTAFFPGLSPRVEP